MMRKRVNVIVEDTCYGCPFCIYNSDYGMSYDSGWDCHNDEAPHHRIADKGVVDRAAKRNLEIYKSKKTLFPNSNQHLAQFNDDQRVENPMKIPSWCPLEEVEDNA